MKTNTISNLKSETARAIAKWYIQRFGDTNIFDNPKEVEKAIDLAISRGAIDAYELRTETINFLTA